MSPPIQSNTTLLQFKQLHTSLARFFCWYNVPLSLACLLLTLWNVIPFFGFILPWFAFTTVLGPAAGVLWEHWWNPLAGDPWAAYDGLSGERQAEMLEGNRLRIQMAFGIVSERTRRQRAREMEHSGGKGYHGGEAIEGNGYRDEGVELREKIAGLQSENDRLGGENRRLNAENGRLEERVVRLGSKEEKLT